MQTQFRLDKKCGSSGIPDHFKCKKQTASLADTSNKQTNSASTQLLITGAGVAVTSGLLGVLAKDVFTSGVPDDKVPPKEPPPGLYDTFEPGDLLYQTDKFAGANRAHYVVYVGKSPSGSHMVFDTSLHMKKAKDGTDTAATSRMAIRSIEEATSTGTSFARAERADGNKSKKPTSEQLLAIVKKLDGKSFDWTGFENNCETLARQVVNDLPISTQTRDVTPLTNTVFTGLISAMAPSGYRRTAVKQENVSRLVRRTMKDMNTVVFDSTPHMQTTTNRLDKKCGGSGIPDNAKCTKGGSWPQAATIGAALTAGGIAAFALSRGGAASPKPSSPESGPPRLPGLTPRGLLSAAPPRKSKTQRMRENTSAAARGAEQAIGRAAQAEITRAGAVANAMASAGEATGMAAKTTLRELRLRTEAARRRFEPGYRRSPSASPKPPAQLPEGVDPSLNIPINPPRRRAPEAAPLDPRTGQPRRRQARGFGRTDNYIPFYAPVALRGIQ